MSEQAPQAPTPAPTPAPSENGPERARPSLKGIDWHDVRQKTISGVFAAAIIGGVAALATYAWNNLSQGGFVRLMGGVTQADLQSAVERVATQAVTNIAVPVQHAIIAFDGPCPPGWILAKEAVGSALVGV